MYGCEDSWWLDEFSEITKEQRGALSSRVGQLGWVVETIRTSTVQAVISLLADHSISAAEMRRLMPVRDFDPKKAYDPIRGNHGPGPRNGRWNNGRK